MITLDFVALQRNARLIYSVSTARHAITTAMEAGPPSLQTQQYWEDADIRWKLRQGSEHPTLQASTLEIDSVDNANAALILIEAELTRLVSETIKP